MVDGGAPEVGDTVELDGHEAPLVVTRVGASPIPLDDRPCAYLERSGLTPDSRFGPFGDSLRPGAGARSSSLETSDA